MPWVMEKMSLLIQVCLTYQKCLTNKDPFNKFWIAICKSHPKYVIMPKIAKKYWVCPELYIKNAIFGSKFASLTQNFKATKTVLPNSQLPFAKAYQNMNYAKNNYKIQKCHFWPKFASFTQFLETGLFFSKIFEITHFLLWICISMPN